MQLTGRSNYRKAGSAVGIDLLKEPTKAEEPNIAARILVWGMSTGAYTGKANRDYLDKSPPDYVNARRIINGTDKASLIAGYAKTFAAALEAAGYGIEPAAPTSVPAEPTTVVVPVIPPAEPIPIEAPRHDGSHEAPTSESFWARFIAAFSKLLKGAA